MKVKWFSDIFISGSVQEDIDKADSIQLARLILSTATGTDLILIISLVTHTLRFFSASGG